MSDDSRTWVRESVAANGRFMALMPKPIARTKGRAYFQQSPVAANFLLAIRRTGKYNVGYSSDYRGVKVTWSPK